jgi:hypothetical protein
MKEIKIIDNLVKSQTLKPIELIFCLQTSLCRITELPQWRLIDSPTFQRIEQLTRVGRLMIKLVTYDVIVANLNDDSQLFWLGYWNDGFVKE